MNSELIAEDAVLERLLRSYAKSAVVFEEGNTGSEMYLVHSGAITLTKRSDTGKPITLAVMSPGDFFGEMALVDDAPRSATAVAIEDTLLVVLDRAKFLFTVRQQPQFALSIMHTLSQRIRALDRQLSSVEGIS